MQGTIGDKKGAGDIRDRLDIREEITAILKKQKEEEKERGKALREQIGALVEARKKEDDGRRKALDAQIRAILEKQKVEDRERKKAAREEISTIARDLAEEEHLKKHHPGLRQSQFLLDQGDVDVRKGFLKLHILGVLEEAPSHGYEIMHRIGLQTGNLWRPSPGSLYPALEALEASGFIACQGDGRRKVYSLTSKGEAAIGDIRKKRQEQYFEMKTFLSGVFGE